MNQLNLMCPIGHTGYGITSFNIYKSLRKKIDITLFPIGQVFLDDKSFAENIVNDVNKQASFDNNAPFLKIWHQFDLASRIGRSKYIALTFFEIDRLKPVEVNMINNTDTILVASRWAKQVLIDNSINTNIVVCPLGIDPTIFNDSVTKDNIEDKEKNPNYIFCNIGKWELRKGHDVLIELFNKAFEEKDNVELWMINHNQFLTQEQNQFWINLYKNSKLGSKIKIIPRVQTHSELAKLISLTDCGIFPARAEGWNNEIPEFFSLNKPVITTNYSAHTEYCDKNNSFLIDIDSLCPAIDDKFFDGYGNWANIGKNQFDQAVEHMRYVYTNKVKDNPNGLKMAKNLIWDNTAQIILENL